MFFCLKRLNDRIIELWRDVARSKYVLWFLSICYKSGNVTFVRHFIFYPTEREDQTMKRIIAVLAIFISLACATTEIYSQIHEVRIGVTGST